MNDISFQKYLVAIELLNKYRKIYPSLEDIEDEVIINDIELCYNIIALYKLKKENFVLNNKKDNDSVQQNVLPWFLKGKKSQAFYNQIIDCRKQEAYADLELLWQEIFLMKNKYAKNRYMNIYEYAIQQKI